MIRDDSLQQQLPKSDFETEPLLFCKATSLVAQAKQKSRAILCTEFAIYLFKQKAGRGYTQSNAIGFSKLSQLRSTASTFSLTVEGVDYVFEDPDAPAIAECLASHFRDVFLPSDLPIIDANDARDLSPSAFLKCVRFRAHLSGRRLSEAFVASAAAHCERVELAFHLGCYDTLDLSEFSEFESYADLVFYALPKHRAFSAIVLPRFFKGMAPFVSGVKAIVIRDSVETDGFDGFVDGSTLERVSLSGSRYEQPLLEAILRLESVSMLAFEDGLTEDGARFVLERFPAGDRPRELALIAVPLPPLDSLCDFAGALRSLDISRCGVDISDLLTALSRCRAAGLQAVTAAGSTALRALPADLQIPASLARLAFPDVEWQNGALSSLFRVLSAPIALDISRARQSADEWLAFHEFAASQTAFAAAELSYDGNPLSGEFLLLLGRAPSLACLSVSGCLSADDAILPDFCSFLKGNRTLTKLRIGGAGRTLGAASKQVLEVLETNQRLRLLDIRDQGIGPELLPLLETFFRQNKTVDELFVDGNGIIDLQAFEALLTRLVARNWRLVLHAPVKDLLALGDVKGLSPAEAERIAGLLRQLGNCPDARPLASVVLAPIGTDPDDPLSGIRHAYIDDVAWHETLQFASMNDEAVHYDMLNDQFSFGALAAGLRRR
jgi:hypothetical protein